MCVGVRARACVRACVCVCSACGNDDMCTQTKTLADWKCFTGREISSNVPLASNLKPQTLTGGVSMDVK